jgi:hypothetical protein
LFIRLLCKKSLLKREGGRMPVVNFARARNGRDFRTFDVQTDDTHARDYIFQPSLTLRPPEERPCKEFPYSLLTYVADCLENEQRRAPVLGIRNDFLAAPVTFAIDVPATESDRHGEFTDAGHETDEVINTIGKPLY